MKSAFELAMEKFGNEPVSQLSGEQKKKIAEIDRTGPVKIDPWVSPDNLRRPRQTDCQRGVGRIVAQHGDQTADRTLGGRREGDGNGLLASCGDRKRLR